MDSPLEVVVENVIHFLAFHEVIISATDGMDNVVAAAPANPGQNSAKPQAESTSKAHAASSETSGRGWRRYYQGGSGHGLTPHFVREHPAFKRNKLTLLSMGIAVVLVCISGSFQQPLSE